MGLHPSGRARSRASVVLSFVAAIAAVGATRPAAAQPKIGLVADNQFDPTGNLAFQLVTAFDPDSGVIFGAAAIPNGFIVGGCAILASPTETRGFVTDFNSHLWSVDLATSPPALSSGTNPISISNGGVDVALSPDGRFAVTCDDRFVEPVSVVDTATNTEVSRFPLQSDCHAVDVCKDGSVLVTSLFNQTVRRLQLGAFGNLTDTGEIQFVNSPVDVTCVSGTTPGALSGIVAAGASSTLQPFMIPGLVPGQGQFVPTFELVTVAASPDGTRVFSRSIGSGIDAFEYDPTTATFGNQLFSAPTPGPSVFLAFDSLAVDPQGSKLYASVSGEGVRVLDAFSGATLSTIPTAAQRPTGVCVASTDLTTPQPPPPPNDDIANAASITSLPYTSFEYTITATTPTTPPLDPTCSGNGHSVWYKYTAPSSGRVLFSTQNSNYDTTLSVYTGSPGSLTQVACEDNDPSLGLQSQIVFDTVAGTPYFIMAASQGSSPGGFLQLFARPKLVVTLSGLGGTVSHVDGTVTLQGIFTCSEPVSVFAYPIEVRQKSGKTIVDSTTALYGLPCNGPTPWSVNLAANSPYKTGQATATVNFNTCGQFECVSGSPSVTVHLTGGNP